jgi:hypothetical protein
LSDVVDDRSPFQANWRSPVSVAFVPLTTPLLAARFEPSGRVVRLTRSSLPLTLDGLASLEIVLARAIPSSERAALGVLLDTRQAPLLADEALERKLGEAAAFLFEGYARRAVLVATAVGSLQARRFGREHQNATQVFNDETEALAFLLA